MNPPMPDKPIPDWSHQSIPVILTRKSVLDGVFSRMKPSHANQSKPPPEVPASTSQ